MFRLSRLSEMELDALIFVLSGISPSTKIADLDCKTKGELRQLIATEGKRVQKAQPERLAPLAHDLSNVVQVALQLGMSQTDLPRDAEELGMVLLQDASYATPKKRTFANEDGETTAGVQAVPRPETIMQSVKKHRMTSKAPPPLDEDHHARGGPCENGRGDKLVTDAAASPTPSKHGQRKQGDPHTGTPEQPASDGFDSTLDAATQKQVHALMDKHAMQEEKDMASLMATLG